MLWRTSGCLVDETLIRMYDTSITLILYRPYNVKVQKFLLKHFSSVRYSLSRVPQSVVLLTTFVLSVVGHRATTL